MQTRCYRLVTSFNMENFTFVTIIFDLSREQQVSNLTGKYYNLDSVSERFSKMKTSVNRDLHRRNRFKIGKMYEALTAMTFNRLLRGSAYILLHP